MRAACAYVQKTGVELLRKPEFREVRLLAGLNDHFTDPAALRLARGAGFEVRVIELERGRFHPKVYWAEQAKKGSFYVGSANLSTNAAEHNAELGVVQSYEGVPPRGLVEFWDEWWSRGTILTEQVLRAYRAAYREKERHRKQEPKVAVVGRAGHFLAMHAHLYGGSHSALQAPESFAEFFNATSRPKTIDVAYAGREYAGRVVVNTRNDGTTTLQLNFGRSGFHEALLERFSVTELKEKLIVFWATATPRSYRAELVEFGSDREEAIVGWCSRKSMTKGHLRAGIGSLLE